MDEKGPKKPDVPNPNLRIEHMADNLKPEDVGKTNITAETTLEDILKDRVKFNDPGLEADIKGIREQYELSTNDLERKAVIDLLQNLLKSYQ